MEPRHDAHSPATDPVHPDTAPDALAKKLFIITVISALAFAGVAMIFVM